MGTRSYGRVNKDENSKFNEDKDRNRNTDGESKILIKFNSLSSLSITFVLYLKYFYIVNKINTWTNRRH